MKLVPHCLVTDIAAAGTAVRLSDTSIKCVAFSLTPLADADIIYVGDKDVSSTNCGAILQNIYGGGTDVTGGLADTYKVGPFWTDGGFVRFDLRDVWVDAATNGDDVCCLYWQVEDDEYQTR